MQRSSEAPIVTSIHCPTRDAPAEHDRCGGARGCESLLLCDAEGRIRYASAAICRDLGYRLDQLLQLRMTDLEPACDPACWSARWRSLHERPTQDLITQQRCGDGRLAEVAVRIQWVESGGSALAVVCMRDLDLDRPRRPVESVRGSDDIYRMMVEQQQDMIIMLDRQRRMLFVSPSACRVLGEPAEALLGRDLLALLHEDDRDRAVAALETLSQPPHHCHVEQRTVTALGWRWFGWSDSAVLDERGEIQAIIGVGRDIHERKLAELAHEEITRHLQLAIEGGGIGIYSADFASGRVRVSPSYLAMLGYPGERLEYPLDWWRDKVHPDDLQAVQALGGPILSGESDRFAAEYRMRHSDGHWVWIQDFAKVFQRATNGTAIRTAGVHLDITPRKTAELELMFQADHDQLTGLLNRRGIWDAILHVHAHCRRAAQGYCIAILDLDHFKWINDRHGHQVGDEVLKRIAALLKSSLREGDWLGRWGGEELILLMPLTTEEQAWGVMERLRALVDAHRITALDQGLRISFSGGVAACARTDQTADDVISRADRALYQAKREGRNRVLRSSDLSAERSTFARLIADAVHQARVWSAVQPIVALQDRALVAEDTLARITNPDGSVLPAASFIDVARRFDLLHEIDRLLLEDTLGRMRHLESGVPLPQFVHISDALLRHPEQIATLAETIEQRLPTAASTPLVLTITEALVDANPGRVVEVLTPLLERGCRLALAGFGGPHSSLRLVADLPVSFLILDLELIRLAMESPRGLAVLAAIQHGARSLGIMTIVKRVEDEASADFMASLGIDWAQGYLFGPPSRPIEHR